MFRKYAEARHYRARHQTFAPPAAVLAYGFVKRQIVISAIVTLVLNGVLTWLIFRGRDDLELWGVGNVVFDLAVSTLMPIFGAALVVTRETHKGLAAGRLLPVPGVLPLALPGRSPIRALLLAVASMIVFGTTATAVLVPFWGPDSTLADLLVFKSVYGVLLSVSVIPIIVFAAFDDRARQPDQPAAGARYPAREPSAGAATVTRRSHTRGPQQGLRGGG